MKKVLIDVTSTIPKRNSYISGIGKSTYWLVEFLDRIPKQEIPFEIELLAVGIKSINFNFYNWNFKHHKILIPKSLTLFGVNVSCIWRNIFIKHDIFHIPAIIDYVSNNECITSVFHDLDRFSITTNDKEKQQYFKISKACKGIVCCSEFSKNEVVKKLQVDECKIDVIYWGCNRNLFRILHKNLISATLNKYNIHDPYFFACSCDNPRKNISTAIEAYHDFLRFNPKHKMVIVWKKPRTEILIEYKNDIKEGKIIFLPNVSDEELVHLYNGASMSIYVSRREGFGFPILESFACGTPVMTCRNSCLEEVGQDAAIYVGEDDVEGMVDVMRLFENNSYNKDTFLNKSQIILSKFSWNNCARGYIQFFNKTLQK